ncbi:hypothetical protein C5S32_01770 [ANME-1 cluster archaeon GoMg1]|nr:hypothetical protein [ANME-1 cluster archaeon GoMg1]
MEYLYIDTGALIALSDKNDKNHKRAVSYLRYVKLFCFAKTFTKKCLRYQPQKQSART